MTPDLTPPEGLKAKIDALTPGAKEWLDDVCHRFADGEGYAKHQPSIDECLSAGLITKKGRFIEVGPDVVNLVYSESYIKLSALNAPPDSWQNGRETRTPRVDSELMDCGHSCGNTHHERMHVDADFARTLERELNEANKNASEWSDLVTQYLQVAADAKAELAAKDALIGELRDAASIYRQAAINAGTDLRAYSHDKECGRYHAIVIGELDEKHQSALRRAEQGKEGEGES